MDHDKFMENLQRSRKAFNEFAKLQTAKGLTIFTPPISDAANRESRYQHRDSGDGLIHLWIEFKEGTRSFTSKEEYPHTEVIVDECYKLDDKPHPAAMYIITSKDGSHCAVVYGWTRYAWTKKTFYDKSRDRDCEFYMVPKHLVRFCKSSEVFV